MGREEGGLHAMPKTNIQEKDITYDSYSNLQHIEDLLGDLHMEVASTSDGITAIQATTRNNGLPLSIVSECIAHAQVANKKILKNMENVCAVPREQQKPCWPSIIEIRVEAKLGFHFRDTFAQLTKAFRRAAIGIRITEIEQDVYEAFAPTQAKTKTLTETILKVQNSFEVPSFEIDAVYPAKVTDIFPNGVMVKLYETMRPQFMTNDCLDFRSFGNAKYLGIEVGTEISVRYLGVDKDGFLELICTEHRMNTDEEFNVLLEKFNDDSKKYVCE